MKSKIFFWGIFFLLLLFVLSISLAQASPIKNFFYNTISFFGIIEITKANHLNSDRVVISDIYEEVNRLDNIWSETIPDGDYIRVKFERNLTSKNDITIYPRVVDGNPRVEVYEKDSKKMIAKFEGLNSNLYNEVYLTSLDGTQDTFDLKVIDGNVEFDHIIDPFKQLDYSGFESGVQGWLFGGGTTGNRDNTVSYWDDDGTLGGSWSAHVEDNAAGSFFNKTFDFSGGWNNVSIRFSHYAAGLDSAEYYQLFCDNTEIMRCTEGTGVSVNMQCTNWAGERTQSLWHNETFTLFSANCTFDTSVQIKFTGVNGLSAVNDDFWVDGINISRASKDMLYPTFSNYWDNNATQVNSGTALFNVTMNNTNGTVWLSINENNYAATNLTSNVYNASVTLTGGTYVYNWSAYGNGTMNYLNTSANRYYTVNSTSTCIYSGTGNWALSCADNCTFATTQTIAGGNNVTITGAGNLTFNSGGKWSFTGASQYVTVGSGCTMYVETGGGWNY